MPLRLKISREQSGEWLFGGFTQHPARRFSDLSEGLRWAEHECSAAPAQIEIWVDDLYVFLEQKRGWPRKVCRVGTTWMAEPRSDGRPKTPSFGERLRLRLAFWRKTIVANARAYSGSKGEVVRHAASILIARRGCGRIPPGKTRITSPRA